MRARVHACVLACVSACVRACVRACARVCVDMCLSVCSRVKCKHVRKTYTCCIMESTVLLETIGSQLMITTLMKCCCN